MDPRSIASDAEAPHKAHSAASTAVHNSASQPPTAEPRCATPGAFATTCAEINAAPSPNGRNRPMLCANTGLPARNAAITATRAIAITTARWRAPALPAVAPNATPTSPAHSVPTGTHPIESTGGTLGSPESPR